MLVGLVAAGYYICFYGGVRGAIWAGAGVAGLELSAFLLPEMRPAVPLLTALWLMLVGRLWGAALEGKVPAGLKGCLHPGRERSGTAHGQGGDVAHWNADIGSMGMHRQKPDVRQADRKERGMGSGYSAGQWERLFLAGGVWLMVRSLAEICAGNALLQIGLLRTALAAALFAMAGLCLLGRGRLYPLWMGVLAVMWLLVGFLGSFAYAENWQAQVMTVSLYVTVGGILVFQQIYCIRQELEDGWLTEKRRELLRVSPGMIPGAFRGAGADFGTGTDWQGEAGREYRELAIFEHDFRHHLDIVAALYEEGCGEEARSYIDDLKQARESRQGRITGGERELSYIMMAKKKACRQAEISFSYQIVGAPRGIARMDMTALLLNLLDNAIRACQEAPRPRSIGVMLLSRGELWEIEMVNSGHYEPGGVRHAAQQGESQQNEAQVGGMKRKVHGIGMVSVKQIVDKYQGICRIWEEDGQVRQKLILVQRGEGMAEP